jgi:error-prone DNA polymerase
LRQVRGLSAADAHQLVGCRCRPYRSPAELARRSLLPRAALTLLAASDAFRSMGLDRRAALWAVKPLGETPLPLFAGLAPAEPAVELPEMALGEHVAEDYATLGLSLKRHPVAFLRASLTARRILRCAALGDAPDGRRVEVAGLVLVRQRPGTASGVIFMTLEDETGIANIIVWPRTFETFRRVVMAGRLVAVRGIVQKEGIVIHVVSERLVDLSGELGALFAPLPRGRGDEVAHGGHDQRELQQRSRDFH